MTIMKWTSAVAAVLACNSFQIAQADDECMPAAIVSRINGDESAIDRRSSRSENWQPLYRGAYLCEGEQVRVRELGVEMQLRYIGSSDPRTVTINSGVLTITPPDENLNPLRRKIFWIFDVLVGPDDKKRQVPLAWRNAGSAMSFITPDLAEDSAVLPYYDFDGFLTVSWTGGQEPFKITVKDAETEGRVVGTASDVSPYVDNSFVRTHTLLLDDLTIGEYELTITDVNDVFLTGKFTVREETPPRMVEETPAGFTADLHHVLEATNLGLIEPDKWAFAGLQSFNSVSGDQEFDSMKARYHEKLMAVSLSGVDPSNIPPTE